jgi:nicotinate-nucleotide adenylyltransferase
VTRARPPAAGADRAGIAARRVGILGGTFDPIHNGHIALAVRALAELPIDELVVIPAGNPPHKLGRRTAPAADRLAMVALAVDDLERVTVDPLETERPGPSYTVDTVAELMATAAAAGRPIAPTVIMSADTFAELPTWHEPDRLVELARIAVAPRRGHRLPDPEPLIARLPGLAGRIEMFDGPDLDVSASEIRARVADGRPIDDLVPTSVAAYIAAHHLYRNPKDRDPHRRKDRT